MPDDFGTELSNQERLRGVDHYVVQYKWITSPRAPKNLVLRAIANRFGRSSSSVEEFGREAHLAVDCRM